MIVETTSYFAKAGKAEAVLEHRRAVTEIRRTLGLDPGRIFVKLEGSGPDVRWECRFVSMEAYESDRARRASSPEFEAARKHMHSLIEKFERHLSTEDSR
ncbi:MAG: NIPSNAP family protein [Pseudomonadota bacterium]